MIVSKSVRAPIRKLSLTGLIAGTVVSVAIAAVPGFPFTEDFTSNALEDPITTADWDTINAQLQLGSATELTTPSVMRDVLGGAGEVPETTRDIALGDLDGDGDLDIVVGNEGLTGQFGPVGGQNKFYENNNGLFDIAPWNLGADASKTHGIALGDLDRDGDLDVVAGNFQGAGVYYLNDGSPSLDDVQFTDGTVFTNQSRRTWKIGLVDIDGDGDLDYIEGNSDSWNALYVNLLMETGTLSFAPEVKVSSDQLATRSIALGDIDSDGDIDLIAGDQNSPNRVYRWNADQNAFQNGFNIQTTAHTTFAVALADLNEDGYLDLVEGSQNMSTQVYLNQGAANPGSFSAPLTVSDSISAHTTVGLSLRDYDRDGHIDIVEGNNGDWDHDNDSGAVTDRVPQPMRLFLGNGDGTFTNGLDDTPPVKQKTYGMDAGDVDGDGQLDFVTGNSVNGNGLPALAGNAVYFNMGTPSATSVQQLDGVAESLEVDGGSAWIRTARLTVDLVRPAVLGELNFFLSNNNGAKWVMATPGIPTAFPDETGTQLKWKVEMLTMSPNATHMPAINQIEIKANRPPIFESIGDINGSEGQTLTPVLLSDYFIDRDSDTLSYQVSGLPPGTGLSIDPATGQLSGVLTNEDAQASPITISASAYDGAETGTGDIILTVENSIDDPPTANDDGPLDVDEGGTLNGTSVLDNDIDPEGLAMTAVLAMGPTNAASFTLNSDGTFVYTHDGTETAADSFTYRADDGNGQSNEATVTIAVTLSDDAPEITLNGSGAINITVGDAYNDAGATASDEEDGDITANLVVGGDVVDPNTVGVYTVTYDVSDSGGNAATQATRTVTVSAVPPPPPPPPPPPSGGGGLFGLWELTGLLFAGLVSSRRRRRWQTEA